MTLREQPGLSYHSQWMRDKRALTPGYYARELRAQAEWRARNRQVLLYIRAHKRRTGETLPMAEARRRLGLPPGDPRFGAKDTTTYTQAMREYAWMLRAEGLLYKQIAHRLGVSTSYARQLGAAEGRLVSCAIQHVIFPREKRYGYKRSRP